MINFYATATAVTLYIIFILSEIEPLNSDSTYEKPANRFAFPLLFFVFLLPKNKGAAQKLSKFIVGDHGQRLKQAFLSFWDHACEQ